MRVYHRLAVHSTEKHLKKGRCPKTFWPELKVYSFCFHVIQIPLYIPLFFCYLL